MLIAVQDCLREANRQLLAQADSYDSHRMPGSTVVVLVLDGEQGAVVWAGDSRIYRRRDAQISQLTRDHSHVQDLVDQNMIKAEDAESHPMANVITRAIGIVEPLEIETRLVDVESKDQFLLCSDGLSRMASDDEIESTLATKSGEEIVQSLLQTALDRGASDNVTLICVQEDMGEDTNEIFLGDLKETNSEDATLVQNAPPLDENTNEIFIGDLEAPPGEEKTMAPDSISLDEFD
jgi:serine/threonine protein phosphatase PrpC